MKIAYLLYLKKYIFYIIWFYFYLIFSFHNSCLVASDDVAFCAT